ncbi:MAG: TraR/DksA family transcriptional regulator [Chitinophagaceae bacterium]|nr:MAG: TraR/DksA family transcriptional regulator [Chitinophagaceae bacterium]
MNQEQREKLIERVEKKILFIKDDLIMLKKASKPISPENAIGRVSRMDAIQNKEITEVSIRNLEANLSNLEKLIELKDSDKLGLCLKCGSEIEFKRLFGFPESPYCMKCSNKS